MALDRGNTTKYEDTGCELHPRCLECPEPNGCAQILAELERQEELAKKRDYNFTTHSYMRDVRDIITGLHFVPKYPQHRRMAEQIAKRKGMLTPWQGESPWEWDAKRGCWASRG